MSFDGILARLALGLAALAASGCSVVTGSASQSPTSHYVFPEARAVPKGKTHGSTTKLCGLLFIEWSSPDEEDVETATQEAIQRAGADLLINVRTDSSKLHIWPLFSICKTDVSGTSAKLEFQPPAAPAAAPTPAAPAAPAGCSSDAECRGGRICRAGACVTP